MINNQEIYPKYRVERAREAYEARQRRIAKEDAPSIVVRGPEP